MCEIYKLNKTHQGRYINSMSVYFQFSEIRTVSSLNSISAECGYLPHKLCNFNSISNREPKIGALNVVWFPTSYDSTK